MDSSDAIPLARGAENTVLHRGDRRCLARPDEVLLEPTRPPELHLGPPGRRTAKGSVRATRWSTRRRPRDRFAGDRLLPDAPASEHSHHQMRPHGRRSGTRARWATPYESPQPHLREHDRDLERHALGRRTPGLPGRQLGDRPQLHLLEQPGPLHEQPAGGPLVPVPIGPASLRRHERFPGPPQLDLRQLARRRDAVRRSGLVHDGGGAEGDIFPGVSCPGAPANGLSTSCGNRFFRNRVGRAPRAFRLPGTIGMFGNVHARREAEQAERQRLLVGRAVQLEHRQLLVREHGRDGTAGSVTGPGEAGRLPAAPPQCCRRIARRASATTTPPSSATWSSAATGPTTTPGRRTATGGAGGQARHCASARITALSRAAAAQAFEQSPEAKALRKRIADLNP